MNAYLDEIDKYVRADHMHSHHKVIDGQPRERDLPQGASGKCVIPQEFIHPGWLHNHPQQNRPARVRVGVPGIVQHLDRIAQAETWRAALASEDVRILLFPRARAIPNPCEY